MSDFSLILENKNSGETSFESLYRIKREHRGEKVGHAGTLDKFASGLMIVMIGNATKLNPIFSSFSKSYRATIRFGSETDTLDPEGEVIRTAPIPGYEEVRSAVHSFSGNQMQIPPVYSAIHVDGKRAYREARKGNEVSLSPRPITVHSISLVSYSDGIAVVDAHVSKGTYIRSLARDIGIKAGSAAHLIALERTSIGPFSLSDIGKSTRELLDQSGLLSAVCLDPAKRMKIENGYLPLRYVLKDDDAERSFCYLHFGDELFGIGEKQEDRIRIIARISNGNL